MHQIHRVAGAQYSGSAISDERGIFHHIDSIFEHLIRLEWDRWDGRSLPALMMGAFLQGNTRFEGASFVMKFRLEHNLLFLCARPRYPADYLTVRELTVAQMASEGNTHKQIALLLQRSPATIRNQMQSIYEKLGVNNVAGLIEAIRQVK